MKLLSHVYLYDSGNIGPTVVGGSNVAVKTLLDEGAIRTAFDEKGIVDIFSFRALQSGHVQFGMVEFELA
jgi:hypothetical protein